MQVSQNYIYTSKSSSASLPQQNQRGMRAARETVFSQQYCTSVYASAEDQAEWWSTTSVMQILLDKITMQVCVMQGRAYGWLISPDATIYIDGRLQL